VEEQWAVEVVVRQEVVVFLEGVPEVAEEDTVFQEGDFLEVGAAVGFEVEGVGSGVAQGTGDEEASVGRNTYTMYIANNYILRKIETI
jgi:hypothetical protein